MYPAGLEKCPRNVTLGAGCVAAVTAATATFPLEIVRRRMMMGAKYKNTLDGARNATQSTQRARALQCRAVSAAAAFRSQAQRGCGGSEGTTDKTDGFRYPNRSACDDIQGRGRGRSLQRVHHQLDQNDPGVGACSFRVNVEQETTAARSRGIVQAS